MFFKQGNLPILSEQGKLLIDECGNIKLAADGNGCIYKSMKIDGVIDDMKKEELSGYLLELLIMHFLIWLIQYYLDLQLMI